MSCAGSNASSLELVQRPRKIHHGRLDRLTKSDAGAASTMTEVQGSEAAVPSSVLQLSDCCDAKQALPQTRLS